MRALCRAVLLVAVAVALAQAAATVRTSAAIGEVGLYLFKRNGAEPVGELRYTVRLTTGEELEQRVPIDFAALTDNQKATLRACGELAIAGAKAREGL